MKIKRVNEMKENVVVGIVAKNSLSYVKSVFDSYRAGETVVLLRSSKDEERVKLTSVSRIIEPEDDFGWFDSIYDFSAADSLAQISFTSGTEGEPKGVFLTHKALSDVSQRLNAVMEVDSSIREYIGVPANFSFGLGRFRAISALGGKAFLPENGFNPFEIRDMLNSGEINAISAVPTLWRILLKNKSVFGSEALKLKWIEIGSQYMGQKEKEELKGLFSNAIIVQHYGLTEASRTTFLRVDQESGNKLDSVGTATGGSEIKISESGRICIRGAHVANQILKQGHIVSNVDAAGWLETNDLGKVLDGYLYYQGRADDLINCSGIKLSPDALERDLFEALNIKEGIAIAPYDNELTGNGVLVAKEKASTLDLQTIFTAIVEILLRYGIDNKNIVKLIQLEALPVTATGKVQRKALSKLFIAGHCEVFDYVLQVGEYVAPRNDFELSLVTVWQALLKREKVGITDNFFELGGDSLTTVMLVNEMELASGIKFDIGDIFSFPTIEQLVSIKQEGREVVSSSIVPLQVKGEGLPLFCLCGINIYQELADSLGVTQPVYGIYVAEEQALMNAVMDGKASDLSVVHLAELYSEAILRKQKEGPYQLAGISFGGLLAIETAQILKSKGADVSVVILLDTILPNGILRSPLSIVKKQVRFCFGWLKKYCKLIKDEEQKRAEMTDLRDRAYRKAMEAYDISGAYYQGQVVLIKAKEQKLGKGVSLKDDYGWAEATTGELIIHEMEGDHLGVIKKPNVLSLASQLKAYLK